MHQLLPVIYDTSFNSTSNELPGLYFNFSTSESGIYKDMMQTAKCTTSHIWQKYSGNIKFAKVINLCNDFTFKKEL